MVDLNGCICRRIYKRATETYDKDILGNGRLGGYHLGIYNLCGLGFVKGAMKMKYDKEWLKTKIILWLGAWFWSETKVRKNLLKWDVAFPHTKKAKKEKSIVPYGLSLAICKAIESVI